MNIIYFETIDSTNNYVKENMDSLSDGDVVWADNQTSGRGRFDRSWEDLGKGNLYITVCLKPSFEMKPSYSNLTQYLSLVICKSLEEISLKPQIKWPNDVLINGKKVAGILAESVVRGEKLKGILIGAGINLNADDKDLLKINQPATAVNLELKKPVDKNEFGKKLLENFFLGLDEFLESGFVSIKEDYEKRISFRGKIKLDVAQNSFEGNFCGFDDCGALILADKNGERQIFSSGEIKF